VLEATPDLTLEELREKLAQQRVFVSYGALWRFLWPLSAVAVTRVTHVTHFTFIKPFHAPAHG
jgi:hypothetical protein